jgi:CHAT domain-containing protein/tetratricopeptide (TPR) repeat protein
MAAVQRSDRVAGIAARAARHRSDPHALHAGALIDLLYEPGTGKPLHRSISLLQTAARLTDRPGPVLADLAAAYLVRAERAGTARDLLAAIDASEEALEHEPRNRTALFNRALALQRFGLVEVAVDGWREYLAMDSASEWAAEARRNLRDVLAGIALPPPAPAAPLSAFTAYAAAHSTGGRVLGWCHILGTWGEAVLADEPAQAEAQVQRAEALGTLLEGRPGGDATLGDGVRAIRAQTGQSGMRRLARAHVDFAAGCALEDQGEFRAAAARFASAAATAEASPVLRTWARLMYGSTRFHSGDAPEGEAIFRRIAAAADPVRHPALAGRARLLLAAAQLRGNRFVAGLDQAGEAAALFARAGERELQGAALDAVSIAHFYLRDMDQGYAFAHRALERLRPYRSSYRLHNLLTFDSRLVADDGFRRAAIRMQDEGVRVADRTGKPLYMAEIRLERALLLAGAGASDRALRDVAAAQPAMGRIGDSTMRDWMDAQRQVVQGTASLPSRPREAAEALDSAAAFFTGMHVPLLALPPIVDGAWARLAAGDPARGAARLEVALSLLEQRRNAIRMESRRAAVFGEAQELVERVVMLRLEAGDTAGALAYLDRGRASLAPAARAGGVGARRPGGEVALSYALVGDTLLAWVGRDGRETLVRTTVDAARLSRMVAQVVQGLETSRGGAELQPALALLHDWLIRPVQGRLGPAESPLVVVADGVLAAVPFAALWDTRRRRYLVEVYPMRFAVSLSEARRAKPPPAAEGSALFVADPAFDTSRHPGFGRLSAAAREVREIAAGYPNRQVLSAAEASGDAVRSALGGAGLLHYAGHAVFDGDRPEHSYLLLAPGRDGSGTETIAAAEIAGMDLRHISLVVLSACRTVRTGPDRASGFSGLAGAFLAAGAGGAVGSLWEVDDRLTGRLMVEFHRAYHASGDAPGALRAAQLRLLRSRSRELSSPAAWAGFRYAGS